MRPACAILLILGLALPAGAQTTRRWSFSGSFNGSVNSAGAVTKAEPVLGYNFNDTFSLYTGIPFYFVDISSTSTMPSGQFMSGIGNAFLGFRAGFDTEVVQYTSNLEFRAPTGDASRGFSTGRVTVDWTNSFSRRISSVTPFGSIGIANTVSDTSFFIRPFSSLGLVGHFEGGATYDVGPVWLGASAYAVRGSGQQRVISKVIARDIQPVSAAASPGRDAGSRNAVFENQGETVSQAEIVNDHGFSTWFGVSPKPQLDFHIGYSRSVSYAYNTVFFGVRFHIGN